MKNQRDTTDKQIEELKIEINEARTISYGIKNKGKKSLKIIGNLFFLTIIISMVSFLVFVNKVKKTGEVPSLFGYQIYQLESGSMEPTLLVGDLILSKEPKDKNSLKVGDVPTFKRGDNIITHRIIEVINEKGKVKYRTKGDNPMNSPDSELLSPDNIKGKMVLKIPLRIGDKDEG